MRFLFLFISFFFVSLAFAQKGYIEGVVYGELDKDPIAYASVRLLSDADSSFVQGTSTSLKGKFKIQASLGTYIIQISYLGYEDKFINISLANDSLNRNLGDILLNTQSYELEGATVIAHVPNIVVRGDTIEYNAAGYKVDDGSVLQDLIKRVPGLEIDSKGNLSANGKTISKILVNGKEFFGNDIKIALENLPVEMIDKLQVFKEKSDMEKLTGFKDGDENHVLNLKVKEEIKRSIFGNIATGYGSDNTYKDKGMINYMQNENQFSIVGGMANIKEEMMMTSGLETSRDIGGRYNIEKSKKLSLNGNINYNNNDSQDEDYSNTQTFLETGNRHTTQESKSNAITNGLNADSYLSWKPDTLTNLYFRISYQNTHTQNYRNSNSSSYVVTSDTVRTNNWSDNRNKTVDNTLNSSLNVGRKLGSKGRSVNLSLTTSLRNGKSNGTNQSETIYSSSGLENKNIDQLLQSTNKSNTTTMSLSYVEPLGKNNFFQIRYSLTQSHSERDRNTYKKDALDKFSVIDTAYTRFTKNNYLGQNFNLSFRSDRDKLHYTIGFNIDPSISKSKILFRDSLIEDVKQSVTNLSPVVRFYLQPKDNVSISADYSGSTSRPTLSQLSADTVNINAQSKSIGNPLLKSGYTNNFNVSFFKSNYEKQTFLNASGSFSYAMNNIADDMIIDSVGNSITRYQNVSGNMNGNFNFMYSAPFKNKKFTYAASIYSNFQRNKSYTNGYETKTNNITFGEMLSLSFVADKFNFYLTSTLSHSIARNNLTEQEDINSTSSTFNGSFSWTLPYKFKLTSDANYSYYGGYSNDFQNKSFVWNAGISKQFLRKNRGELRFDVFDILNDKNNVTRTVYSGGISDSRSKTINRYCMLTFSYRFSILKGVKKNDQEEDFSDYY